MQPSRHAVGFAYAFGGRFPALFDLDNQVLVTSERPLPAPAAMSKSIEVSNWKDSLRPMINGQAVALEPGEMSVAMAVAASGDAAALGSNWFVRLFDARGREVWRTATPGPCWAVASTLPTRPSPGWSLRSAMEPFAGTGATTVSNSWRSSRTRIANAG
ncbi:MAG: hypothetical protein IPN64_00150 [Propionivibrio sp.]|uniref:hypothetical protein n=1 Tax=Propionivibrio sp. TaxID=2212460 RepID=UPI0025F5DC5A|nr:hypothetical protein [Propionivibrio sp.]MBK8892510.1 hypothetical protein [Propionivibrio sp.]